MEEAWYEDGDKQTGDKLNSCRKAMVGDERFILRTLNICWLNFFTHNKLGIMLFLFLLYDLNFEEMCNSSLIIHEKRHLFI